VVADEQILDELENLIGKPIPRVKKMKKNAFGVKVQAGKIIELGLPDSGLTQLPQNFGTLSALRILNLVNNQLTELPVNFKGLTYLKHLKYLYQTLLAAS